MTTAALHTTADGVSGVATRRMLERAFAACLAFLLFGDYLALSAAHLLTGTPTGWIACTTAVQLLALPLALVLGRLRRALRQPEVLWFLGLGAVMLLHLALAQVRGRDLNEYGRDKLLAWFFLCGPALLCGLAGPRGARPPGGMGWLLVLAAPLLLGCALSLASDPAQLTIAYYHRLHAHGGLLVQPAHQALAFVLGKLALACCAWSLLAERGARAALLTAAAALLGLAMLSGARGFALALVAALAALWIAARRPLWVALAALVLGGCLYHFGSTEVVRERFDPAVALESLAYQERAEAWATAWDAWCAAPLLGHGPGGFADFDGWGYRTYPHNIFLEVACECGLLGLLCFLGLLASVARRAWRARGEALDGARAFAYGLLLFSLLGSQSVGDWIRNSHLLLAVGLVVAATGGRRTRDEVCGRSLSRSAPRRVARTAAAGAGPLLPP